MTDAQTSDRGTSPYPQPGEILEEKYEIREVLGTGAMGAVVAAQHLLRKAPVALKFMSPEIVSKPGVVERFLNEGVAASKIDSEHVVKVFDVSKLPSGVPYIVMEYLEGEDLAAILQRARPHGLRDVPRAVHFVLQILRGLQVAHRANIVHRDMKPANCFVVTGQEGDPDHIKIVDFGISKVREDGEGLELTQAGSALGTPLYMSPEQARSPKDVDLRSDLYGVAAMLYELLAGRQPLIPQSGTMSELFVMLATEDPPDLAHYRQDLPPGLWDAVRRGLEKSAENRYQTAAQMAEGLAPFADERSSYVLAKLLRGASTATTRNSFRPPPMTSTGGAGAVSLGASAGMGVVVSTSADGSLDQTMPQQGQAAQTAAGTLQGTTVEPSRQSTPLVWAIAVVAVLAVAAAAWALGQVTASTGDSTAATPSGVVPPPVPSAIPAPAPPPTASAPASSEASASATASAPPPPVPATEPTPPPSRPRIQDLGRD